MNLYVISFKSVYGTLKMDLNWRIYKTLKLMTETNFFFWLKKNLGERMKVEDNLHITCLNCKKGYNKKKKGVPQIVFFFHNIVCTQLLLACTQWALVPHLGSLVLVRFFCFMHIEPIAFVSPLFKRCNCVSTWPTLYNGQWYICNNLFGLKLY